MVILGWIGFGVKNGDPHFLVAPSWTFGGDPTKARASDLTLRDWKVAGLGPGSFIRCGRIWTLPPEAFFFSKGLVGTLDTSDRDAVMAGVASFFSVEGWVAA